MFVHHLAIALGAIGMWLASPQTQAVRHQRAFGKTLAAVGLLVLLWQLPTGADGAMGAISLIISGGLIAAAAATVVAEQLRSAAICFCLAVLALYGLLMLAGAWATALVVATLLAVACAVARRFFSPPNRPVNRPATADGRAARETSSWEPMLGAATAAVIVGIMSTPAHNRELVGPIVFGMGLMGLISRRTNERLFLSAGIMLIGPLLTAFAWSRCGGRFADIGAAAAIAVAGGVWMAAGFRLVRPRASYEEQPGRMDARYMDARYYVLLTAMAVVVLMGVLKLGS